MYKILIIVLLFFLPLSSFSENSEICSLTIENSEYISSSNIPSTHTDFSYCNLVGIELNDRDLSNANFFAADLSGAYFYGST